MAINLLEKARQLESRIARRLDSAAQGFAGSGAREPLEILHAVVDAAAHEVQPGGRGKRVFPFNRITVTLVSSSPSARAHLEALFGDPPLRHRILERLRSRGCELDSLVVDVKYVPRTQKGWLSPDFHVGFARTAEPEPVAAAVERAQPRLELTLLNGTANHKKHAFAAERIHLGRCAEVRDSRNRLIRTNDLAFAEGPVAGAVNNSVSRQHAHISYSGTTGHYRLHDDGSAHGTSVVRSGRTVAVPTGSRGVRLQSGDEILLGEVRLRVRIVSE